MSKFRWMRWIAWAALTCLLVALGVGIYEAQPRQPRWQTAHQPLTPNHERKWIRSVSFDPAGTTLLTFPARRTSAEMRNAFASLIDDASNLLEPAKLGIWDRATGKKLASYPRSAIFTNAANFSKDYHYCASDSQDKDAQYFVTIVDFHKGNEINVPLKERPYSNYLFSPHGDFLVRHDIVQMDDEATPLVIYESVSGRVLDERQSFRVVSFSEDYLLHVVDRKKSHDSVELWSLAAKKPVATLSRNGWFVEDLSSDGRSVIFRKFGETGEVEERAYWDLTSREFAVLPNPWGDYPSSPDRQWAVVLDLDGGYCLRDTKTGRKRGSLPTNLWFTNWPLFSSDSRFMIVPFGERQQGFALPTRPHAIEVLSVPSLDAVWKGGAGDVCQDIAIGQDEKTIYAALKAKTAVTLFDIESGETRAYIDMACLGPTTMKSTPDRRLLLIHRTQDKIASPAARSIPGHVIHWISSWFPRPPSSALETIVVYDTALQRERFRLTGWECVGAWLSDDGATLITTHDEGVCTVMRCWDVGWKPLHCAVGIPAAIGAGLVALALGFGRWRRRKAGVQSDKR